MTAMDRVLTALSEQGMTVGAIDGHHVAQCPTHDGKSLSLSLSKSQRVVVLKCHAGCRVEDIVHQLGLAWSDLFEWL